MNSEITQLRNLVIELGGNPDLIRQSIFNELKKEIQDNERRKGDNFYNLRKTNIAEKIRSLYPWIWRIRFDFKTQTYEKGVFSSEYLAKQCCYGFTDCRENGGRPVSVCSVNISDDDIYKIDQLGNYFYIQ